MKALRPAMRFSRNQIIGALDPPRRHLARDCDPAYHRSVAQVVNLRTHNRMVPAESESHSYRVSDPTQVNNLRHIIAIVGPTASGKSELAIGVALRLGGEIINCDSVQVYQEIQIATAKVPVQRATRHSASPD